MNKFTMSAVLLLFSAILDVTISITVCKSRACNDFNEKNVLAVLLARNKEHVLPYFLHYFERLNYPKRNIALYIRSDHNEDGTINALKSWTLMHRKEYRFVDSVLENWPEKYEDTEPWKWSPERHRHLIFLKEAALTVGRENKMDYIWFLDMDIFLTNENVLQNLIKENKTVVAPKLDSITYYSTFWGSMSESHWYKTSDDYRDIIEGNKNGCFPVALLHTCVLINLKHNSSKLLTFLKEKVPASDRNTIPEVDVIIFALSAQRNNIQMHVCNKDLYGYMLQIQTENYVEKDSNQIIDEFFLDSIYYKKYSSGEGCPYKVIDNDTKEVSNPKVKNFGVDKIYCIYLKRRHQKRVNMEMKFAKLGLDVTFFEGFDWKKLNSSFVTGKMIRQLKTGHAFVFNTKMTYGLVGNFLAHFYIWKDIIENNLKEVIIFEDDAEIQYNFVEKVEELQEEIKRLNLDWEYIFLGRTDRRVLEGSQVPDSELIAKATYSYWTGAYMLNRSGAIKLFAGNPLQKIIPVDHYISVMSDTFPYRDTNVQFSPRNLKSYALKCNAAWHVFRLSDTSYSPALSEVMEIDYNGIIQPNQTEYLL